jgi:hypothetical protein
MSTVIQIIGLVALTVGCALAWLPLGFIVFGIAVLTLGALMERDTPSRGQ